MTVTRLMPDGSPDPTFDGDGTATIDFGSLADLAGDAVLRAGRQDRRRRQHAGRNGGHRGRAPQSRRIGGARPSAATERPRRLRKRRLFRKRGGARAEGADRRRRREDGRRRLCGGPVAGLTQASAPARATGGETRRSPRGAPRGPREHGSAGRPARRPPSGSRRSARARSTGIQSSCWVPVSSTGRPSSAPAGGSTSSPSFAPMSPPHNMTSAAMGRGRCASAWHARHAPWENPPKMVRSGSTPSAASRSSVSWTCVIAREQPGSLAAPRVHEPLRIQLRSGAAGVTQAMPGNDPLRQLPHRVGLQPASVQEHQHLLGLGGGHVVQGHAQPVSLLTRRRRAVIRSLTMLSPGRGSRIENSA